MRIIARISDIFKPCSAPVQTADVDIKFLFQKFEQGRIDGKFFVRGRHRIADAPFALFQGDGLQDERRVFFLAVLAGIPLQKAEREIEDLGARFLVRFLAALDEAAQRFVQHHLFGKGAQGTARNFEGDQFPHIPRFRRGSEKDFAPRKLATAAVAPARVISPLSFERGKRRIGVGGEHVQDHLLGRETEQGVFQGKVEQAALPLLVLGLFAV